MADPGVQASLHKNLKTTLPRIDNYINSTRFSSVNLKGGLYADSRPVCKLKENIVNKMCEELLFDIAVVFSSSSSSSITSASSSSL